jgi:hypothetical protein
VEILRPLSPAEFAAARDGGRPEMAGGLSVALMREARGGGDGVEEGGGAGLGSALRTGWGETDSGRLAVGDVHTGVAGGPQAPAAAATQAAGAEASQRPANVQTAAGAEPRRELPGSPAALWRLAGATRRHFAAQVAAAAEIVGDGQAAGGTPAPGPAAAEPAGFAARARAWLAESAGREA